MNIENHSDLPLVRLLDEDEIFICLLYLKDEPATILRPVLVQHDAHVKAWYNFLEEDYYQFMKEILSSLPHDEDCCCTLCV